MSFAILFAIVALAGVLAFFGYYYAVTNPRKNTLDWVALQEQKKPLTLACRRHPMKKKDALAALIITVVYAATAFFQLGSLSAPQTFADFAGNKSLTIEISGEPVYVAGLRYYCGLGTGIEARDKTNSAYNVEVSKDGREWLTLWQRHEDEGDPAKITGYYWAQAQDYEPSYALTQTYSQLLKWQDVETSNPQRVRYLRLTGRTRSEVMRLGKLILLDDQGEPVGFDYTVTQADEGLETAAAGLFAPDASVPEEPDWYNSAYFDEIYHARTAQEHIEGLEPYEWTHPPLGKLIIGLGIRMFGLNPFGWRFMGTLFGVLMLPILYIFLKNLFGKTPVAVCGTALFAADFMHLTQTRIATIDTYGVFFVLTSYFFFYRWLSASATPRRRRERPGEGYLSLALSGVFFGLGCASKWTVIYAGAGLAVLYVIHLILRFRAWQPEKGGPRRWAWLLKTLGVSVLAFLIIPGIIYTLAYWPYAAARGVTVSLSSVFRGFGESLPVFFQNVWGKLTQGAMFQAKAIPADTLSGIMVKNQWDMFNYHQGIHSTHAFSSQWYQWLVDARPILYFSKSPAAGSIRSFASFNNPLISWAGLGAILVCMARCFRRLWAKLAALGVLGIGCAGLYYLRGRVENGDFDPDLGSHALLAQGLLTVVFLLVFLVGAALVCWADQDRQSGKALFISLGFLAQFLPWVLVNRTTYAYHYFPSMLFLVLAICCLFDDLLESPRAKWRWPVYGLTGGAVGLYALYYPVLIGLTVPAWYAQGILRWFPTWPIY